MKERTEYVGVHLIDMPCSIPGITVMVDSDTFCILINARLSHEQQCTAYDHEINHIDNKDFDMMYDVNELESIRHSIAG